MKLKILLIIYSAYYNIKIIYRALQNLKFKDPLSLSIYAPFLFSLKHNQSLHH